MKRIQCLHCNTITTVDEIKPGDLIICQSCKHVLAHIPNNSTYQSDSCPYCGMAIASNDISVFCPECQMEYHLDCWNDGGGCATYGCKMTGILHIDRLIIKPEDLESRNSRLINFASSIPMPGGGNGIPGSKVNEYQNYCNNCKIMVEGEICPFCNKPTKKICSYLFFAIITTIVCLLISIIITCVEFNLIQEVSSKRTLNYGILYIISILFGIPAISSAIISNAFKHQNKYNSAEKLGYASLVFSSLSIILIFLFSIIIVLTRYGL